MKREYLDRVEELAREAAALCGVELVDVEYKTARDNPVLRLYIDKTGGVLVEDCARVSRAMGDALDTEDPIPSRYRLEVSSPGVDKALKGLKDFERYRGFPVQMVLRRPYEGQSVVCGKIAACGGDSVGLLIESGTEISFRLEDIARARLDVDPWEMAKMKRKKKHAG